MWQKSDTDLEAGSVHMGKVILDIVKSFVVLFSIIIVLPFFLDKSNSEQIAAQTFVILLFSIAVGIRNTFKRKG